MTNALEGWACRSQRLVLPGGERTWTVLGRDHVPVGPAEEYLEYLRVQRVSPNTVKSYARALALWWEYLEQFGLGWDAVTLEAVGGFLTWLRTGEGPQVVSLEAGPARFAESTIAVRLRAVLSCYTYHQLNGVDVGVNARLRSDLFVTGGVGTGNTRFNSCDAFVDNPKTGFGIATLAAYPATPGTGTTFAYCDYDTSWLSAIKATGSYTLPWQGIQIGGVLQNLPGQMVLAFWNITQADVAANGSLGRPLSGGANTSRVVPLIKPGTKYLPRWNQVDVRPLTEPT